MTPPTPEEVRALMERAYVEESNPKVPTRLSCLLGDLCAALESSTRAREQAEQEVLIWLAVAIIREPRTDTRTAAPADIMCFDGTTLDRCEGRDRTLQRLAGLADGGTMTAMGEIRLLKKCQRCTAYYLCPKCWTALRKAALRRKP